MPVVIDPFPHAVLHSPVPPTPVGSFPTHNRPHSAFYVTSILVLFNLSQLPIPHSTLLFSHLVSWSVSIDMHMHTLEYTHTLKSAYDRKYAVFVFLNLVYYCTLDLHSFSCQYDFHLLYVKYCSVVCICHIFFIHSFLCKVGYF